VDRAGYGYLYRGVVVEWITVQAHDTGQLKNIESRLLRRWNSYAICIICMPATKAAW
jgi:hypothetical protein